MIHDALHPEPAVEMIIAAAMDEELEPYLAGAENVRETGQVGPLRWLEASLDGHPILLVRSGIGLVNGAMGATITLRHYHCPLVVSVGSAGGFEGKVEIGQVVVGSTYAYHGADARAFGYELGQVPGMPVRYEADATALARVRDLPDVVVGPTVSGDSFVAGPLVDAVRANFPDAVATEMEATAIAQACYSLGVGFISVRGISDLCGVDAAGDHARTVRKVSAASADVVAHLLTD